MDKVLLVTTLVGLVVAFSVVLLLVPLLEPVAKRIGLVDIPEGRKLHSGNIPLIGGLVIFVGYVTALVVMGQQDLLRLPEFWVWVSLLGLSLWDDVRHIRVAIRVLIQILLIILLCVYSGIQLEHLGHLLGDEPVMLGSFALPVTVLGLIGIKNGLNLIDGVDGLAGTQVLAVLFWFIALSLGNGISMMVMLYVPLAGGVLGFLVYNLRLPNRPSRIFLGDSGSVFLGFTLGWFAVIGSQRAIPAFSPIEAVWVLGLPILDTIRVMVSRIAKGHSPFAPARDHLHHLLLKSGWSVNSVVTALLFASLMMGGVAWMGRLLGLSEMLLFVVFLTVSLIFFLGIQHLDHRLRQDRNAGGEAGK